MIYHQIEGISKRIHRSYLEDMILLGAYRVRRLWSSRFFLAGAEEMPVKAISWRGAPPAHL